MKHPPFLLIGLLTMSLPACHKQETPAQAVMDAEARQKAVEVRAAADAAIIAQQTGATREKATVKEAAKAPLPPR